MAIDFYKAKVDKVLMFFLVASFNFYQIVGVDLKVFQYIHILIFGWLIYVALFNKKRIPGQCCSKTILVLMHLPLLSVYSCNVINGQSVGLSLIVYRMHLGWLIFFYLCKQQVPLPNILKTIFVVGMGYALITLVQQVTYPITPFGTRAVGSAYSDFFSGGVEKRMGFYRFSVGGLYYGVLAFFFVLVSFRLPHKRLLLVILGASIVACGNRQTMFSVFVSVVYYYLFSKNVKNKYLILVMLLIVVFFLYVSADAIFGKLVNIEGDLEDGRMPSYIFYWDKITDSPLAFLLGNGLPNSASSYGQQIDVYDNFRVTPSDIGIVGTMYYWGGIYVVAYLVAAIKWLKDGRLPILYKAIILSFLLCCPIAGFLWEIDGFMLQGIIFYLCDANVRLKV